MGAKTHAGLHVKFHYFNLILTKIGISKDSSKTQNIRLHENPFSVQTDGVVLMGTKKTLLLKL
jgi:hypothetical protein